MCMLKFSVNKFTYFCFFHYANLTITGSNLNNTNKYFILLFHLEVMFNCNLKSILAIPL